MTTVTILFLGLLILLIIGSLALVICLIVKEGGKNKKIYQENYPVSRDTACSQRGAEDTVGSSDRMSEIDIEYLKKIKNLKDNGVLSEEEYKAEREKIL